MPNVSTPAAGYSLPTPSPLSQSVASTRLSSTSSIHLSNLLLRLFVLLLSFVSALSLAKKKKGEDHNSFDEYPESKYCFISTILAFVYSAYQLFKAASDIAYRGFLISDRISDYSSFILDQLTGYLLISSSSVAVTAIQHVDPKTLWKAAIISTCMSFSAFIVIFASGLLSGYKLCKRIIW